MLIIDHVHMFVCRPLHSAKRTLRTQEASQNNQFNLFDMWLFQLDPHGSYGELLSRLRYTTLEIQKEIGTD